MIDTTRAADWIGRTEVATGCLTPQLAGMLGAAVSHPLAAERDTGAGACLPQLWHWAAFPEFVPLSELGEDGHPRLGRFLPPLGFGRRMWAAGRVSFEGRLRIGEGLRRTSEIRAVTPKTGGAGEMVFVTVAHRIEGETGAFVEEEQDIVYLHIPDRYTAPARMPDLPAPDFEEAVAINEARLFRFSAATYNAHRIHYDLPYTQGVEKYPALVTHGPMQAIMLMEAATRHAGAPPRRFRFRGVHPMFHDHGLRLQGRRAADGLSMDLGTAAPEGYLGMTATAEWA
ncbi:MaoC family dehydratase N-terminal domain-containing protein [Roseibacterium sp. SDUM158017]|uniref:FAS1-like dehydratase domain-containing protein n=1 Tax=Roseicyclus salinarum TaxID=3036773 RepID=UPI0024155FA1|nr:MaoC family dehydratase N-terminal domain-containing protein [Roseibacterium sp. SDUM158017]MDG4647752.1 MaoC family dehydratase N-terminal domain-containing protein [Roseibacterium sp. SDUM158017]